MEVAFCSSKLKKALNDPVRRAKTFGPECAQRIAVRLNTLAAADNLAVVLSLPGRLHALHGDREGQFSLDLKHPLRLLLVPANDPLPRTCDGGLDLSGITEITIVGVEDTHD